MTFLAINLLNEKKEEEEKAKDILKRNCEAKEVGVTSVRDRIRKRFDAISSFSPSHSVWVPSHSKKTINEEEANIVSPFAALFLSSLSLSSPSTVPPILVPL